MKRLLAFLLVLTVLLGGCAKETKKLELQSNEVYADPKNPTPKQIEAFNLLGEEISKKDEKAIVKQAAISFAYDFFSFKNKDSEKDIGGLTYFQESKRDKTKDYVLFYYYKNYSLIVNQYGAESLPQVKEVVAVDPAEAKFEDKDLGKINAYQVRLSLAYEDTKLPDNALKTDAVITMVKYEGVYRVVAID